MSYVMATNSGKREKRRKKAWSNKYLQTIITRREEKKI